MSLGGKIFAAQNKMKIQDFERYKYGALAARLLASEDSARFAPSALEVLAGSKGLNFGEEALEFIKSYGPITPEQLRNVAGVWAGKFEEARGGYKPSELAQWYEPILTGLEKTEKDKILAQLNYDETLKEISEKLQDAATILKASDRLFTPEKKAEAKKTVDKYQSVMSIIALLDSYKFESLRPDAVEADRTKTLKDLAAKL